MTYSVKEIFLTVQGEGGQAGRPAVFLRFSGCNLWNGLERDRATSVCTFCDTDFVGTNGEGGGKFSTPEALADAVAGLWRGGEGDPRLVVCTGGEPLLQLDEALIAALHARGFEIAIESNGTIAAGADHQLRVPCPAPPHRRDMVGQGVRGGELAAPVAVGPDEIGVAEGADGRGAVALQPVPQVAAGEPQEDGRTPGLSALALHSQKDLLGGVAHIRATHSAWPTARSSQAGQSPQP